EYKKIFNETYLIIPKILLEKYNDFDKTVGLITYCEEVKDFHLERKPIKNEHIDIDVLMEVLHTKEYLKIVSEYYSKIPEMNAFNQFQICKDLIADIPYFELNKLFLKVIKERKINNSFFNK